MGQDRRQETLVSFTKGDFCDLMNPHNLTEPPKVNGVKLMYLEYSFLYS